MIFSIEIEQQFIATLLQNPKNYGLVANFVDYKDFYSETSKVNRTVFSVLKSLLEKNEAVDPIVLSERVKALGISFEDNISISDYIHSLSMRRTSADALISLAKELKKYTIRREIYYSCRDVAKKMKDMSEDSSYSDIINHADSIFNEKINMYESGDSKPENIAEEMEFLIEERGNNPIEEFGLVGPYKKLHEIYGSLLRPGNISVLVARSGVGKTAFCMNFATKIALMHNVPILHFDNGEMSKEELIMRQTAALAKVPMHLLETGKWRQHSEETVRKVREVWSKIKDLKFYYYNVGGMSSDEMINTLRRFYYSTIGRGNPLVFSFDYIKPSSKMEKGQSEWQQIGEMVDKFKTCIHKEILHDGLPVIPMITSVQSNRQGITNNRAAENVVDDESIVSLSDRITQYCSHLFILRKKTTDEIVDEGEHFGTHKLINLKSRHLGKDIAGALEPVRVGDQLRRNFINFEFKNFDIEERGDLRDIQAFRNADANIDEDGQIEIPNLDEL